MGRSLLAEQRVGGAFGLGSNTSGSAGHTIAIAFTLYHAKIATLCRRLADASALYRSDVLGGGLLIVSGASEADVIDARAESHLYGEDANYIYNIVFGRNPEYDPSGYDGSGALLDDFVVGALMSEEFFRVQQHLVSGLPLPHGRNLDAAAWDGAQAWLKRRAPAGVRPLRRGDWWGLLDWFLDAFEGAMAPEAGPYVPPAIIRLVKQQAREASDWIEPIAPSSSSSSATSSTQVAEPRPESGAKGIEPAIRADDGVADRLEEWRSVAEGTGLFDADYYRRQVAILEAGADPLHHYLTSGFMSYISPGPDFDEIEFLALSPSVREHRQPGLVRYGRLSAFERAEWRRRRAAILETRGRVGWIDPGAQHPDADIPVERMRGVSFFDRFGFLFEGDTDLVHARAAVRELAARRPALAGGLGASVDVSIVIPAYGQMPYVLNCLDSLCRQRTDYRFEILVYDDVSPDAAVTGLLRLIPWVTYVRGETNLGFLKACNAATKFCRGRHLVLLNSDIRVAPTWLQELIDTFRDHPKAGLVGSKLFNADGTLQEAGGVIWPDATGHNVGRDDDPGRPQYCYARQVDYCSGAAIALPMDLWRALGGFDERFAPAYYEDTDIAFRVRQAGRQTWYQPMALAVHYEGRTNGRDLERGVKAYQRVNEAVFKTTWAATLASHPRKDTPILIAADRAARYRLLVLDANILTPDQDSGSITTLRMIECFQELGWAVTFAAMHNLGFDPVYSARLQRMGVEVLHTPFVQTIDDIIDHRGDEYDVVLGLRHTVLFPLYESLRGRLPLARILFHNMDLHYLRLEREAALTGDRRKIARAEVAHDEEMFLASVADCTLVTSHAEEEIIRQEIKDARLLTYPYTMDVLPAQRPHGDRFDILFFGGFRHTPNVDAAEVLCRDIWPKLVDRLPAEARLVLAGSEMPESVRSLAGGRIVALGFVPDLRAVIEEARVFVAPLRYGAGVKGKLVTALANGLPSVCSSITVEGMGLADGRETLVAETPSDFAEAILRLYDDADLWRDIQSGGYRFVETTYSREAGLEKCRQALAIADAHWLMERRRRREQAMADHT